LGTTGIRTHLPGLSLALIIALATRIAWVAFVHPDPTDGRFDDTAWYRGAAHFLSIGDGYVNPFVGTPTAGWPPGYPFFLGTVFRLFGEGTMQTCAANIALAVATVALVYAIGAVAFGRGVALGGAVALAAWPGQVYFASLTLSEPLFTFLFALAALLMLVAPQSGRARGAAVLAFGVALGAATLTRGQALVLLPVAVAFWAQPLRWRPAAGWGMLAALVVALMLAPWAARNEQRLGSPVILATNFGPNIWIGNHEGATGRMNIPEPEPPQPERGDMTQPEFEVAAERLALRKGLAYILQHPEEQFRLVPLKLRAMYESDATALDWNSRYDDGYYRPDGIAGLLRGTANGVWFGALAFAAIGAAASRGAARGAAGALLALALLWTATHLLFFGDARFHYPIVFVVALFATRGVAACAAVARRAQPALLRRYAAA